LEGGHGGYDVREALGKVEQRDPGGAFVGSFVELFGLYLPGASSRGTRAEPVANRTAGGS
jgi:hypothetical protein